MVISIAETSVMKLQHSAPTSRIPAKCRSEFRVRFVFSLLTTCKQYATNVIIRKGTRKLTAINNDDDDDDQYFHESDKSDWKDNNDDKDDEKNDAIYSDRLDTKSKSNLLDSQCISDHQQFSLNAMKIPSKTPSSTECDINENSGENNNELLPFELSEGGVPVVRPNMSQFADFNIMMSRLHPMIHKVGLLKVVPPQQWINDKKVHYERASSILIEHPLRQVVTGRSGYYEVLNIEQAPLHVRDYEKACETSASTKFSRRNGASNNDIERKFWSGITMSPATYGADCVGTLFDEKQYSWNISNLRDELKYLRHSIPGINQSYLYFGSWKSMFAWHTEDADLFSINYIHFGSPKQWYGIPPRYAHKFERVAQSLFPDSHKICGEFLRHKSFMVSPTLLRKCGIPVHTTLHCEGEFMITFPRAYHAGFNHGYNCAESVNFATPDWFEVGMKALSCQCETSVSIDVKQLLFDIVQWHEKNAQSQPQWLQDLVTKYDICEAYNLYSMSAASLIS